MPTIFEVKESWRGETGSWSHTGEPGSGVTNAERLFTVTTTADARSLDVLSDNRIPQRGDAHPYNSFLRCRGSNARKTGPVSFEVTSRYDVRAALDDGIPNPLEEPPVIRISTLKESGEISEDINGAPIATVNGERYTGITRQFSDMAIAITRNLPAFDPFNIDNFADKVNSDTFLNFPPGRLRIDTIEAENINSDGLNYWRATVVIHSRKPISTTALRAWWVRLPHEGYWIKDSDGKPVRARDSERNWTANPVPLDLDGNQLQQGENYEWLEFEVYESIQFGLLGLLD